MPNSSSSATPACCSETWPESALSLGSPARHRSALGTKSKKKAMTAVLATNGANLVHLFRAGTAGTLR
eukprot:12899462-Prorocentrum_lima.AAC.1